MTSGDDDKVIRKLLKQYKSIELSLKKFNSKKYNNPSSLNLKGNILRLTLLPFLRNHQSLSKSFQYNSPTYKSLSTVIISISIKWWLSLIDNLMESQLNLLDDFSSIHISSVLTSDRNAYLEGISRILSLEYWKWVDDDLELKYKSLLSKTLEYSLEKMSTLKNLSLSISAFIGKVLAFSFFYLPEVNTALLFLLSVKQESLEKTNEILNIKPNYYDEQDLNHLNWLINFGGVKCPRRRKSCVNCVPPPKHPVKGIKDPNGNWVRRWSSCDSNVFNSFFRHYIYIIGNLYKNNHSLANCPGFSVILSHIIQIFQISITRISNKQSNSSPTMRNTDNQIPSPGSPGNKPVDIYHNSVIKILKTIRFILYDAQDNLDVRHTSHPELSISRQLARHVDDFLVNIAQGTTIHDANRLGLILNVSHEFINHVVNNIPDSADLINWEFWLSCSYMLIKNTDHIQILLKNFAFIFNTWDLIPDALAGPNTLESCYDWIKYMDESFKVNFSYWLIDKESFCRFTTHWNPAIRSYYLRLLVWRIIGINNYHSSASLQTSKKLQMSLNLSHEVLTTFTSNYENSVELDYKPDNPLVNRKLGILPINTKDEYLSAVEDSTSNLFAATPIIPSEIRKTHPFEILDEAVYSCSSLPTRTENLSDDSIDEQTKEKYSNPIVNSLGKLFKILSTDGNNTKSSPAPDRRKNNSLTSLNKSGDKPFKRNSLSLTSLSTYSSKLSKTSSTSVMSFSSNPTSISEESPISSIGDDSSVASSIGTVDLVNQLQKFTSHSSEFSKMPPEIVRPSYKFDVIIDNESMGYKFDMINYKNGVVRREKRLSTRQKIQPDPKSNQTKFLPTCPRIPLITIFVNSDAYNTKFYFNDERNLIIEDADIQNSTDVEEQSGLINEFSNILMEGSTKLNDRALMKLINLGRSLNELNAIIAEFKNYLNSRIEVDQFNLEFNSSKYLDERNYFRKIIPFLSIDSSNESKLLNAS